MLLVLFCLLISAGLGVTYLQLRRELDVVRNRLVTGAACWILYPQLSVAKFFLLLLPYMLHHHTLCISVLLNLLFSIILD